MCIDNHNKSDGNLQASDMDENKQDGLNIRRIAGGCMVNHPPLFSLDGEMIFVIWDDIVRAFNITTGEFVRDLEGAAENIVGICIDKSNPKFLYGLTENCILIAWKWRSGVLHYRRKLNALTTKIQTFNKIYDNNGLASFLITDLTNFAIYNLKTEVVDVNMKFKLTDNETSHIVAIGAPGFNYFLASFQNKIITVRYGAKIAQHFFMHMNEKMVTVMCGHPKEDMVAIGDSMGRIVLYKYLMSAQTAIKSIYHWHANPVNTICFSSCGRHLYSGGKERCLVKWNVGRPEEKQFMPRLSDTIRHIAVDQYNFKIALCTADNGIQILNALNYQTAIIQIFSCISDDGTNPNLFPAELKVNPRTQNLVLNGRVGSLQIFSTYTRSFLYTLDITMKNINTLEKNKLIYNTQVTNVAVNSYWMVTSECFDDNEYSIDSRLKFWMYDESKQTYALNTNIENVHIGGVTAIEFSNLVREKDIICATAGNDDCVNVWSPEEAEHTNKIVWMCVGKIRYKNYPVKSISFSQDGSLLATGFGNVLCAWNSDNLKLKCALSAPSGLDGSINQAVINIPSNKGSNPQISRVDYIAKRKNIVQKMFQVLHKGESSSFLKTLTVEKGSRHITKNDAFVSENPNNLDENEKRQVCNRIRLVNELSLMQKVELFQKLGIHCRTSTGMHDKILEKLKKAKQISTEAEANLQHRIDMLSSSAKFSAKRKMHNYISRKSKTGDLLNFTKIFSTSVIKKQKQINVERDTVESVPVLPMKNLSQIRHVLFCHGEFSHLVIVCTEHKLFVWNLLTLRMQVTVQLTVNKLVIDQYTNLVAAFTDQDELYVFMPNMPIPLYHRKCLPKILGAAWVPRRYPKSCSFNLDWQAVSQLYFLNDKQELLHLVSDSDDESLGPVVYLNESQHSSLPNTPFAAMLAKQVNSSAVTHNLKRFSGKIGVPGQYNVKEIIGSSSHTMAPVNLLCNDFIKSLLVTEVDKINSKKANDDDDDAEVDDGSESENEEEINQKILARKNYMQTANKATSKASKQPAHKEANLAKLLDEGFDFDL